MKNSQYKKNSKIENIEYILHICIILITQEKVKIGNILLEYLQYHLK
jgi:hypothetical protein